MHPKSPFLISKRTEVAVFIFVERIKEALLDVRIRLPEVDVDDVRGNAAGYGHQRAGIHAHPLYRDAREAAQFNFDLVPVVTPIRRGIGFIAVAVPFGKGFGEAVLECIHRRHLGLVSGICPGGVRQVKQLQMDDRRAVRPILDPTALRCVAQQKQKQKRDE